LSGLLFHEVEIIADADDFGKTMSLEDVKNSNVSAVNQRDETFSMNKHTISQPSWYGKSRQS
jgi:hypothetical protein